MLLQPQLKIPAEGNTGTPVAKNPITTFWLADAEGVKQLLVIPGRFPFISLLFIFPHPILLGFAVSSTTLPHPNLISSLPASVLPSQLVWAATSSSSPLPFSLEFEPHPHQFLTRMPDSSRGSRPPLTSESKSYPY